VCSSADTQVLDYSGYSIVKHHPRSLVTWIVIVRPCTAPQKHINLVVGKNAQCLVGVVQINWLDKTHPSSAVYAGIEEGSTLHLHYDG
jgi:hypothetical protein